MVSAPNTRKRPQPLPGAPDVARLERLDAWQPAAGTESSSALRSHEVEQAQQHKDDDDNLGNGRPSDSKDGQEGDHNGLPQETRRSTPLRY